MNSTQSFHFECISIDTRLAKQSRPRKAGERRLKKRPTRSPSYKSSMLGRSLVLEYHARDCHLLLRDAGPQIIVGPQPSRNATRFVRSCAARQPHLIFFAFHDFPLPDIDPPVMRPPSSFSAGQLDLHVVLGPCRLTCDVENMKGPVQLAPKCCRTQSWRVYVKSNWSLKNIKGQRMISPRSRHLSG